MRAPLRILLPLVASISIGGVALPASAAAVSCPGANPVVHENNCMGSGTTAWQLSDPSDQLAGFTTQSSVDRGQSVTLKIGRNADPGSTAVDVQVFRMGYYGGTGGAWMPLASATDVTVNNRTNCSGTDPETGISSCDWDPTYTIPASGLPASGVYLVKIEATDSGIQNHVVFTVRDDHRATPSKVLFQLPVATYQAYNNWGGKSLYSFNSFGPPTVASAPRAVKVSFDRPFVNSTGYYYNDWLLKADWAAIYFLEQQGYDVSYTDDYAVTQSPAALADHETIVIPGHSEYWTGEQMAGMKAARDAGTSIVHFGANSAYWKVRYEDGGRTMVGYKTVESGPDGTNDPGPDGVEGTADDALGLDGVAGTSDDRPESSTTTFRDDGAPPGDPNAPPEGRVGPDSPENSLFGVLYVGHDELHSYPLHVPAGNATGEMAADRVWRSTDVDAESAVDIGSKIVGFEWDAIPSQTQYLEHQPAGVRRLARTTPTIAPGWLQDEGRVVDAQPPPGQAPVVDTVKYRAPSGALVFSAGTIQWSWGLGPHYVDDPGNPGSLFAGPPVDTSDDRIRQATVNILADQGVDPATPDDVVVDHGDSPPHAAIAVTPNPTEAGTTATLDGSGSYDQDGEIVSYEWDVDGNGSYETDSGTDNTIEHVYQDVGTINVGIRVTDDHGHVRTAATALTIQAGPTGPYSEAVLGTASLRHYWRLGELGGTLLADSVGGATAQFNDATLNTTGALSGDVNGAVGFDGDGEAASAQVDLSNTNRLTVEFWLRWDGYANDDSLALELTDNFNAVDGGFLVDPNAPEAGGKFAVGIGSASKRNNVYFNRPSAGEYHHYAFVLDSTKPASQQITPYVDGKAVPYTKLASNNAAGTFANSTLHMMSRAGSALFGAGDLDELAIYADALDAETIRQHRILGAGSVGNAQPEPAFTISPPAAVTDQPVTFDGASSVDPDGSIVRYEWDLDGDGSFETDGGATPTATRSYSASQMLVVRLRVTDSDGATAVTTRALSVAPGPTGAYSSSVFGTPSLRHYWRLGESPGSSSFADSRGGATATLAGPVLGVGGAIASDPDAAASFDGDGDVVSAPVDLSDTSRLTVEFWLRWDGYANDDRLALELTDNFNAFDGGLLVDPNAGEAGGRFAVGIGRGSSRNNVYFDRPSAGEYHHYAFAIDSNAPASQQIVPYVDGVAVPYTKLASGSGAGPFAAADLNVMSRGGSALFGTGDLDELAIYAEALGSETISQHYALGTGIVGNRPPIARLAATPTTVMTGQQVALDGASSVDPDGSIVRYEWDLDGDGAFETDSGTTATAAHAYAQPGQHLARLRVTDDEGETAVASATVTVLPGASGDYSASVLDVPSLRYYWRLGDAPGSSAFVDSVGGAAAPVSGPTPGAAGALLGDSDSAASFDGAGDVAGAPVTLSSTSKLTVEFWLRWDGYANDDSLALELTDNFNGFDGGFLVNPNAGEEGGKFAVGIGRDSSRNNVYFDRPSAGEYHHYAFVLDSTAPAAQQIKPYVDGKPVHYVKLASGTSAGAFANATLHLMSRAGSALFGAGDLDELAIYADALDAETIRQHRILGAGSIDNNAPVAAFDYSPASALTDQQVSFDGGDSIDSDGSIVRYEWDLDGDGSFETDGGATPTATQSYGQPGQRTVRLRVTDDEGATAVATADLIVLPGPTGPYSSSVFGTPSLRHYWRLGEQEGSAALADSVGGAHASVTGAQLGVAGAIAEADAAASFDGDGDVVSAPIDLSNTSRLTVEFWLSWDAFANDDRLALELTDNFNAFDGGLLVDPNAGEEGGKFAVGIGRGATRNNVYFDRPSAGGYHHYAFAIDTNAPAGEQIVPYVDGVAVPFTKTASGTGAGNFAAADLNVMSRAGNALFGAGDLDELAIYADTLDAATIAARYALGQ